METKIFINLPVKNLKNAISFYNELGFLTDLRFTNEKGACIIISKNIHVMLLVEEFYGTFTDKQICDAKTTSEVLIAVSVETKKEVDEIIEKAVKAGGTDYRRKQDFEWMYQRTFLDLDGHQWEFFYMDETQIPEQM